MTKYRTYQVGQAQKTALAVYVFDPAVVDDLAGIDVRLVGRELSFDPADTERLFHVMIVAANSADEDAERLSGNDAKLARQDRDALQRLITRLVKEMVG